MRAAYALLMGLLSAATPALARAAEVAVVAAPATHVDAGSVAQALALARPGITVVAPRLEDAEHARATATIDSARDGFVVVSYRDGAGRLATRALILGTRPENRVAAVILELRDELAALSRIVGAPAHASTRGLAAVRPTSGLPFLSVEAGIGVASRGLQVGRLEAGSARSHDASPFTTFRIALTMRPWRAVGAGGPLGWMGICGRLVRGFSLVTRGPTDLGESIDVETTYQDLEAGFSVSVPISGEGGPRLRPLVGWAARSFEVNPVQMSVVRGERQFPTFVYDGPIVGVDGEAPLGSSGLIVAAGLRYHSVVDVGQAVRDTFGSDSRDGWGFGLRASITRELFQRLDAALGVEVRRYETDLAGPSLDGGSDDRGRAVDRYLDATFALSYRPL